MIQHWLSNHSELVTVHPILLYFWLHLTPGCTCRSWALLINFIMCDYVWIFLSCLTTSCIMVLVLYLLSVPCNSLVKLCICWSDLSLCFRQVQLRIKKTTPKNGFNSDLDWLALRFYTEPWVVLLLSHEWFYFWAVSGSTSAPRVVFLSSMHSSQAIPLH